MDCDNCYAINVDDLLAERDRLRAVVDQITFVVHEHRSICDPAPHTSERALIERITFALDMEAGDERD